MMESGKITYYSEISQMMFGFGDSHSPNPDTVRLVESILLQQLRTLVQEALNIVTESTSVERNSYF
nr:unnamed protein product [Callosobruchus chinensis]